jgi:hypothetical protein
MHQNGMFAKDGGPRIHFIGELNYITYHFLVAYVK